MNKLLCSCKSKFLRFALIFVVFLLSICFINSSVWADSTSDIYNYSGPNSQQKVQETNGVLYTTWIAVNGQKGPYASSNPTQPGSNSIINIDACNNLSEQIYIENKSDKPLNTLDYVIGLPRFYDPSSNVVFSGSALPSNFGDVTVKPDLYVNNTNTPSDLRSIRLGGTLAPKQKCELTIPLKTIDSSSIDLNSNKDSFSIFNTFYDSTNGYAGNTITAYARFGKLMTDSNGNNPLKSTGKYIATTKNEDGSYSLLPENIQQLMPDMNAHNELTVDDFYAGYGKTNDSQYYTGAHYYVKLDWIKNAVSNQGYSVAVNPNDNKLYDYYTYNTDPGAKIIDPNTGKETDVIGKNGNGTVYVELRKVIDAHDSTIDQGSNWNPADNAKIVDHSGKTVDIDNNPDIKVTGTVNTAVPGQYKIIYTYIPDEVSKTIAVTVKGNNNSGDSSNNTSNSNPDNSSNNTSNQSSNVNNTSTEPIPSDGNVAIKGEAVYSIKKIGLYKKSDFTNSSRIKWYQRVKRINRPEFIVKGYNRNKAGVLRYRVQQYNPYTRKYVNNTNGYITANSKYVIPVYYTSLPKSRKIKVINLKGINEYRQISLNGKLHHYKIGHIFSIKKVLKYKYATRFVLSNNYYITANKKLVIEDK